MNDVCLRIIARYIHQYDPFEMEIENNDLECFKYSHEHDFPYCEHHNEMMISKMYDDEMILATRNGNLEIVKYICEYLRLRTSDVFEAIKCAIESNQFECLKYLLQFIQLRDSKYIDDRLKTTLCEIAIRYSTLEYLKYLCEHGIYCKNMIYGVNAIDVAIEENKYDHVKYLVSLGCISKQWKIPKEHLDYVIQIIKSNII